MPLSLYRLATGHGVALVSMPNFEASLYGYTRPRIIHPSAQPVDEFPLRTDILDGTERGDGRIDLDWLIDFLPQDAFDWYIVTHLVTSGAIVVSKAATIYTKAYTATGLGWKRYNCYACFPQPNVDYRQRKDGVADLRLRFRDLEAL